MKKLCLVCLLFLVVLLVLPIFQISNVHATQHNFGYETIGTVGVVTLENYIVGSIFTITENGVADSITAALRVTTKGKNMKCAIYYHGNLSLVGQTSQVSVPVTDPAAWKTFNFTDPKPNLTANTVYILVAWSYSNSGIGTLAYDAGDTNQGHYIATTYDGFPNPLLTPSHYNFKFSIYCTYTVVGGQEYSRSASQSIAFSLVASKLFEITRPAAQAIGITLTGTRLFDITRLASQGISFNLATARIADFIRTASQTFNIGFATSRIGEFFRSVTQTITTTLNANRLIEVTRQASQTIDFVLTGFGSILHEFMRDASLFISVKVAFLPEPTITLALAMALIVIACVVTYAVAKTID